MLDSECTSDGDKSGGMRTERRIIEEDEEGDEESGSSRSTVKPTCHVIGEIAKIAQSQNLAALAGSFLCASVLSLSSLLVFPSPPPSPPSAVHLLLSMVSVPC